MVELYFVMDIMRSKNYPLRREVGSLVAFVENTLRRDSPGLRGTRHCQLLRRDSSQEHISSNVLCRSSTYLDNNKT